MVKRHKNPRLCASTQGKELISAARKNKKWDWDTKTNYEPLELASRAIDSEWSLLQANGYYEPVWADGIHEGSWRRFLAAKEPVKARVFQAYCTILELDWYEVVDRDTINGEYLFPCASARTDRPIAGDASTFVKDVTIPDGTIMSAGENFTKIWRIRNTGTVPWKGRFLERVGKCKGLALILSEPKVKIPNTSPGDLVDIRAELQAPYVATTGTRAMWKMIDSQGLLCFPDRYNCGLVVEISVVEPEK